MSVQVLDKPRIRYDRAHGKGVQIHLSAGDISWCWDVGRQWRREAVADGKTEMAKYDDDYAGEAQAISIQAFGVMGELATCRALDVPYHPKGGVYRTESDIDPHVGARTVSVERYGMWVRERDSADDREVLTLLHAVPQFRPAPRYDAADVIVVGWYPVWNAKQNSKWWRQVIVPNKPDGWTVPQESLYGMDELKRVVHEQLDDMVARL